jgi:hypothetical protein
VIYNLITEVRPNERTVMGCSKWQLLTEVCKGIKVICAYTSSVSKSACKNTISDTEKRAVLELKTK